MEYKCSPAVNLLVPQTLGALAADRRVAELSKRDKELQFPVHSKVKGFTMPVVFPSGKKDRYSTY